MTIENLNCRKRPVLCLLVLMVVLCTACGSKLVRGEPPVIRMTELSHRDNGISLQLSMRNLNGVDLNVQNIEFRLTVRKDEDTDENELIAYQGLVGTSIVANGTESWSVDAVESEASRKLLESLENGDVISLPYKLKGSITSKDEGTMRFEYEGHIYPLPGKPGYFR
jgi:hypothetical protein